MDEVVEVEQSEVTEDTPVVEESDALGDAGIKALQDERKARRAAERAAKAAQAEIEKLREATLSETERAIAEAKRLGREEALTEANSRLVFAEAKAAATGRLTDPADIAAFIDLAQFDVSEDGSVDTKAINSAIDDLLKSKPYLAAQRVGGSVDGGARGKPQSAQSDMNSLIRRAAGRG
jgi:hypothetical protein